MDPQQYLAAQTQNFSDFLSIAQIHHLNLLLESDLFMRISDKYAAMAQRSLLLPPPAALQPGHLALKPDEGSFILQDVQDILSAPTSVAIESVEISGTESRCFYLAVSQALHITLAQLVQVIHKTVLSMTEDQFKRCVDRPTLSREGYLKLRETVSGTWGGEMEMRLLVAAYKERLAFFTVSKITADANMNTQMFGTKKAEIIVCLNHCMYSGPYLETGFDHWNLIQARVQTQSGVTVRTFFTPSQLRQHLSAIEDRISDQIGIRLQHTFVRSRVRANWHTYLQPQNQLQRAPLWINEVVAHSKCEWPVINGKGEVVGCQCHSRTGNHTARAASATAPIQGAAAAPAAAPAVSASLDDIPRLETASGDSHRPVSSSSTPDDETHSEHPASSAAGATAAFNTARVAEDAIQVKKEAAHTMIDFSNPVVQHIAFPPGVPLPVPDQRPDGYASSDDADMTLQSVTVVDQNVAFPQHAASAQAAHAAEAVLLQPSAVQEKEQSMLQTPKSLTPPQHSPPLSTHPRHIAQYKALLRFVEKNRTKLDHMRYEIFTTAARPAEAVLSPSSDYLPGFMGVLPTDVSRKPNTWVSDYPGVLMWKQLYDQFAAEWHVPTSVDVTALDYLITSRTLARWLGVFKPVQDSIPDYDKKTQRMGWEMKMVLVGDPRVPGTIVNSPHGLHKILKDGTKVKAEANCWLAAKDGDIIPKVTIVDNQKWEETLGHKIQVPGDAVQIVRKAGSAIGLKDELFAAYTEEDDGKDYFTEDPIYCDTCMGKNDILEAVKCAKCNTRRHRTCFLGKPFMTQWLCPQHEVLQTQPEQLSASLFGDSDDVDMTSVPSSTQANEAAKRQEKAHLHGIQTAAAASASDEQDKLTMPTVLDDITGGHGKDLHPRLLLELRKSPEFGTSIDTVHPQGYMGHAHAFHCDFVRHVGKLAYKAVAVWASQQPDLQNRFIEQLPTSVHKHISRQPPKIKFDATAHPLAHPTDVFIVGIINMEDKLLEIEFESKKKDPPVHALAAGQMFVTRSTRYCQVKRVAKKTSDFSRTWLQVMFRMTEATASLQKLTLMSMAMLVPQVLILRERKPPVFETVTMHNMRVNPDDEKGEQPEHDIYPTTNNDHDSLVKLGAAMVKYLPTLTVQRQMLRGTPIEKGSKTLVYTRDPPAPFPPQIMPSLGQIEAALSTDRALWAVSDYSNDELRAYTPQPLAEALKDQTNVHIDWIAEEAAPAAASAVPLETKKKKKKEKEKRKDVETSDAMEDDEDRPLTTKAKKAKITTEEEEEEKAARKAAKKAERKAAKQAEKDDDEGKSAKMLTDEDEKSETAKNTYDEDNGSTIMFQLIQRNKKDPDAFIDGYIKYRKKVGLLVDDGLFLAKAAEVMESAPLLAMAWTLASTRHL
jgi:hypothetical protein